MIEVYLIDSEIVCFSVKTLIKKINFLFFI